MIKLCFESHLNQSGKSIFLLLRCSDLLEFLRAAAGGRLFDRALEDISNGIIMRSQQDERLSTFEPGTDVKDIYKPDL